MDATGQKAFLQIREVELGRTLLHRLVKRKALDGQNTRERVAAGEF